MTLLGADLDAVKTGFTHEFIAKHQDPIFCSLVKVEESLKMNVSDKQEEV